MALTTSKTKPKRVVAVPLATSLALSSPPAFKRVERDPEKESQYVASAPPPEAIVPADRHGPIDLGELPGAAKPPVSPSPANQPPELDTRVVTPAPAPDPYAGMSNILRAAWMKLDRGESLVTSDIVGLQRAELSRLSTHPKYQAPVAPATVAPGDVPSQRTREDYRRITGLDPTREELARFVQTGAVSIRRTDTGISGGPPQAIQEQKSAAESYRRIKARAAAQARIGKLEPGAVEGLTDADKQAIFRLNASNGGLVGGVAVPAGGQPGLAQGPRVVTAPSPEGTLGHPLASPPRGGGPPSGGPGGPSGAGETPFEKWLNSAASRDLNGDGKIDIQDFNRSQAEGQGGAVPPAGGGQTQPDPSVPKPGPGGTPPSEMTKLGWTWNVEKQKWDPPVKTMEGQQGAGGAAPAGAEAAPPTPSSIEDLLQRLRNQGASEAELNYVRSAFQGGGVSRALDAANDVVEGRAKVTIRNRRYSELTQQLMQDPGMNVDWAALRAEDPELLKMITSFYNSDPAFQTRLETLLGQRAAEGAANQPEGAEEPPAEPAVEGGAVLPSGGFESFFNFASALDRGESIDAATFNGLPPEIQAALREHPSFRVTWGEGSTGEPGPGKEDVYTEPPPAEPAGVKEEDLTPPPPAGVVITPEQDEKIEIAQGIFDAAPEGLKFDAWFQALDVLFPEGNHPVQIGGGDFEAWTPEQQSVLRNSIEAAITGAINQIGFDPTEERRNRRAVIDRDYDEAAVRLGRQFGIDPGGEKTGRAMRSFEALEVARLNSIDQLESEISQRVTVVKQRNLELLTNSLSQIGGLELETERVRGGLALDIIKLKETVREFNTTLSNRLYEFSRTFGLDEAKTEAIISQINQDIINSTRKISAEISQSWADITGQTGTVAPINAEDLGVDLTSLNDRMKSNPVLGMPGMLSTTPEASAVRGSFKAMFGRNPTAQEVDSILRGGSLEVAGAPTLESRQLAATVTEQRLERASKYDAIAQQNDLDRDRFDQAKTETDRQWSLTTLDVAEIVGVDGDKFRLARHQYDKILRGIEATRPITPADKQSAAETSAGNHGIPLPKFLRANDLFDANFGIKVEQIALQNGMDAKTFERANRQADAQEDRLEATWAGILNAGRKDEKISLNPEHESYLRNPDGTVLFNVQTIMQERVNQQQAVRSGASEDSVATPEIDKLKTWYSDRSGGLELTTEQIISLVGGNEISLPFMAKDWWTAFSPEQLQSIIALINGGNFSPERSGGSAWGDFGQSIGQIITAIILAG